MKKLIIKRSNLHDEYILEVTGYIPKDLEVDFEAMAEKFAEEEKLLLEEIYEEVYKFRRYHKGRNGLIINFQINSETYPMEEELIEEFGPIRTVTINIQVRRTFVRVLKEIF